MKIFFVAMLDSIHTARWVSQIKEKGWDIYLFPTDEHFNIHPDIKDMHICIPFYKLFKWLSNIGLGKLYIFFYRSVRFIDVRLRKDYYAQRLHAYIKKTDPDLVHSLETTRAGYLVIRARKLYTDKSRFPVWWHANWGSDLYLFGRLPEHSGRIREVLENCDYYSCECQRDIELAKKFGFTKHSFPVYPNTGGFDTRAVEAARNASQVTSMRKIIMLKGYQGWAGRALVGIRALERCRDILQGYTVVIYSNTNAEDIKIAACLLSQSTGIEVTLLPLYTDHMEILSYHSRARVSIGLSISDAISTSLLEAMAMGSFPIQSCTACASEWIENGVSGAIVHPEDPETVETAIRKALSDDKLVNSAAEINLDKIKKDANFEKLQQLTIQSYQTIFKNKK